MTFLDLQQAILEASIENPEIVNATIVFSPPPQDTNGIKTAYATNTVAFYIENNIIEFSLEGDRTLIGSTGILEGGL